MVWNKRLNFQGKTPNTKVIRWKNNCSAAAAGQTLISSQTIHPIPQLLKIWLLLPTDFILHNSNSHSPAGMIRIALLDSLSIKGQWLFKQGSTNGCIELVFYLSVLSPYWSCQCCNGFPWKCQRSQGQTSLWDNRLSPYPRNIVVISLQHPNYLWIANLSE